jgi:hypothetical protein
MNLSELSIEDLADLRDRVISQVNDRVAARQRELQGEIDRLGGVVKPSTSRPKRLVKYRDGNLEWSGCGTMPAWAKLKGGTHLHLILADLALLPRQITPATSTAESCADGGISPRLEIVPGDENST